MARRPGSDPAASLDRGLLRRHVDEQTVGLTGKPFDEQAAIDDMRDTFELDAFEMGAF